MKKIISLALVVALAFSLCACGGSEGNNDSVNNADDNNSSNGVFVTQTDPNYPVTMGMFYRNTIGADIVSDDPTVKEIDKKADALLKSIEDAPDTLKANGGKTYYISADGSDKNDGLTPETAKRDYMALKTFLAEGDLVLFRRGDLFRGQIKLVSGVSYGAYGEGIKPRFYGSTDGLDGEWLETETKHVYKFNQSIGNYSNIVFNNGESVGRPVKELKDITKRELNTCWQGRIYVYSPDGNPGEIFDSIEIVDGYSLFTGSGGTLENVHVQNLCLMYAGVHGFGSLGYSKNVTIEGCIIGFMGGRDLYKGGKSLGNAIEFMGGANNCTVRNNYLFQCYDTGVTHQGPMTNAQSADFDDINYDNNLIEYCVWAIESWIYARNGATDEDKATGNTWTYGTVNVTNNICRYSGWGWGSLDRPDKNVYADLTYTSKNHAAPLNIKNNIFDRSRRNAINLQAGTDASLLYLENNQVIVGRGTRIASIGETCGSVAEFETFLNKYSNHATGNTAIDVTK